MTTGQRIKAARKSAGMTQEELGQKLGVSGSAIAQYETDKRKPKMETLRRIADALGIQPWELDGQVKDMSNILMFISQQIALNRAIKEDCGDTPLAALRNTELGDYIDSMDEDSVETSLFNILNTCFAQEVSTHSSQTDIVTELLSFFDQLNPDGQQKAVERVGELTELPRYRADTPIPESTPTADTPSSED